MTVPKLSIVRRITPRHGELFADRWREVSDLEGAMGEAFDAGKVVTWPDDDGPLTPEQARYHALPARSGGAFPRP